jgi:hypothetical protein
MARHDRGVDGCRILVWSAGTPTVVAGEPVALHGRYRVLAAGARQINVAVIGDVSSRS